MISFLIFLCPFLWANHGSISVVNNDAWIIKAGEEDEEELERGMNVSEGDRIKTGSESYVKILMTDKNILHVGPDTEMELAAYNSEKDGAKESIINVIYGRVRTALDQKYDGTTSKFKVNTETAVLGVRGTDFVTTGSMESSRTVVFEGQVGAQGLDSAGQPLGNQLVSPGEMTSVVKGQAPMPPVKVPLEMLSQLDALSQSAQPFGDALPNPADMAALAGAGISGLAGSGDDDDQENEDEKKEEPKKEEPEMPDQTADDSEDQESGDILVALKYGTMGAAIEAGYPLTPDFHVKLEAYNSLGYTASQGDDDEGYEATLNFSGLGILGQWGSQGAFQLVFGAYLASNNLEVDGNPFGNESVGDSDFNFDAGTTMSGEGKFANGIAPYVGIGFNIGILGLFDLVGDIGLMSIGALQVDSLEYSPRPTGMTDADVDAEIAEIEEETSKYKTYPIVRVGIGYSF